LSRRFLCRRARTDEDATVEKSNATAYSLNGLRTTAKAVAAQYEDEGAIVISVGKEGVRIGTEGLSFQQIHDALCIAINYNFTSTR
jgi:hypothetical protein